MLQMNKVLTTLLLKFVTGLCSSSFVNSSLNLNKHMESIFIADQTIASTKNMRFRTFYRKTTSQTRLVSSALNETCLS